MHDVVRMSSFVWTLSFFQMTMYLYIREIVLHIVVFHLRPLSKYRTNGILMHPYTLIRKTVPDLTSRKTNKNSLPV